jgi:DNA polymerase III sliding clamp (beta) subunit (PCNA family)
VTEIKSALSSVLKIAKDSPVLVESRGEKLFVGTYTDYHKVVYETPYNGDSFKFVISTEMATLLSEIMFGEFIIDDSSVVVSNNRDRTEISTLVSDITLLSLAKGYEKSSLLKFSAKEIKSAFNYTRHASNDKKIADTVLHGFHLKLSPSSAEVMASNGAMLSLFSIYHGDMNFSESKILLLNGDFFNLLKTFSDEGEIGLSYNENSISLTQYGQGFTIRAISALTKGNPLGYTSVVESSKNSVNMSFSVDRVELMDAVRQIKLFSEENNRCTISITPEDKIVVSSVGKKGKADREIPCLFVKKNKAIDVSINIQYLLSYLSSARGDRILIGTSGEDSPVCMEDGFGIELIAPFKK